MITIPSTGYVKLNDDFSNYLTASFATIANYDTITPTKNISVYASAGRCYLFGELGTVITGLYVTLWYTK